MVTLHVLPLAHVLQPVYDTPPHCPYLATVHVAAAAADDDVEEATVDVANVVAVVAAAADDFEVTTAAAELLTPVPVPEPGHTEGPGMS